MATKFLEPGGDADFGIALWSTSSATGTIPAPATDFVNSTHVKSIKYFNNGTSSLTQLAVLADSGSRWSNWFYFNALPSATASLVANLTSGSTPVSRIRITSAGVIQLWETSAQIGSNGGTIATGGWHRISYAHTITSTTVNQFRVWIDGVLSITITNATISNTGSSGFNIGNSSGNASLDFRTSDHYVDNSSALTDPGNIYVTAKRPFSNGTTNGFTTQIGSGGSGYGTGHAPQVNERPLSTTNGWSMVGAGSAITEEYSIEGLSVGDFNLTGGTIVDFMGWVDVKALVAETGQIIVAGTSSSISVTTSASILTKIAGSTTYPAGGTDIGVITSTAVTTFSLYEAGVVVAYIPSSSTSISITQVGATLTFTGGTQATALNLPQTHATLTFTGGTQVIASVQDIAVGQVGATITFTGGTQAVAAIQIVSITQVGASLTFTGGSQTTALNLPQSHATLTFTGGTQVVASIQDVSISQSAATITFTGGTQSIATVNIVSISQVAAILTFSGGTQTVAGSATLANSGFLQFM